MKKALPAPQVNGGSRFLPIAAADKYTEGGHCGLRHCPDASRNKSASPAAGTRFVLFVCLLQPKTTSTASSGRKMPCISYLLKPP